MSDLKPPKVAKLLKTKNSVKLCGYSAKLCGKKNSKLTLNNIMPTPNHYPLFEHWYKTMDWLLDRCDRMTYPQIVQTVSGQLNFPAEKSTTDY